MKTTDQTEVRCRTLQFATMAAKRESTDEPFQPTRVGVILDEGLSTERFMLVNVADQIVFTFWQKDPELGSS